MFVGVLGSSLNGIIKNMSSGDFLMAWKRDDLDRFLTEQFSIPVKQRTGKKPTKEDKQKQAAILAAAKKAGLSEPPPQPPLEAAWTFAQPYLFAVVLTADAVVTAAGSWAGDRKPGLPGDTYALVGLDRADGSERWRIPLPGIPLEDGLAVAADGTVVVQLLDGGVVGVR